MLFVIFGCEDFLEEEVYTEFEPDAFLQDQSGIDALLTGAYGQLDLTDFGGGRDYTIILGEFPTDIAWETGGGLERSVIPIMGFNWDPTIEYFDGRYNELYSAIAAANNVLLVTSTVDGVNQEILSKAEAEARFI
ncbi:MAG: hypothetical protein ABJD98_10005, partial [Maribacter dokdonensis]|uniref:hypothetical protein n=1 Tax=Maribacter dokdonensis TaxID=320912 RepID=UPI003264BADF